MSRRFMGTVLLVEDDPDLREMLAAFLHNEGHAVVTAANGREALDCLRGNPGHCVILLDLMMPVMNGWQFRDEQRRDPMLSTIPVVVLSAVANGQHHAASLGASAYVRKPIQFDDLIATVGRFCRAAT
jgi:CheY-like chemotaxis protein